MDYEKAYKEVLSRAKTKYDSMMEQGVVGMAENIAELFPELKESEDERIRTKLLNLLKELLELGGVAQDTWSRNDCEQFIAWLEKQGSPNLANSAKTCKIEPKFKVGDKIKYAGGPDHCAEKIIAIRNDAYYFSEVVSLPFIEQDKWELVGQKPADKIEQNPAWSEEDEKMVGCIRVIIEKYAFSQSAVDVNGDLCEREFIEPDEWLRTLKEKCTWKPSDEQMSQLECVAKQNKDNMLGKELMTLFNDLKRLLKI